MRKQRNTNCLAGIRCPRCQQADLFSIQATAWFRVSDDGTDTFGDVVWDRTSAIRCPACGQTGTVAGFTEEPG